jgi:pSer/pThr/pTyr-binding forkhead associated (FHA) protein
MAVKLQVVMTIPGKDAREFEYEFEEDRIGIGRDQENEIQVPLSTVSRKHCVLYRDGTEWFLEDLKSTHGTKHNGRPIGAGGKKLLRNGDSIDLIHFKITFQNAEQASPDYSAEKTEALARKMVEEVLATIGKDGGAVPYVRVMNGPDEGKRFEIGVDVSEVIVGRGNDCDFQINDANISRRHAVIRRDWNEITIDDAGSKNGVVINDRKISRATAMRDADEILLGAVRLTFIDPSAKFLGKLDDIPAFAEPTSHEAEHEAVVDEEAGSDEEVDDENDREHDSAENAAAPTQTSAKVASGDDDAEQLLAGPVDDGNETEADPFDETQVQKGLGAVEIGLIGAAILAVVGLAVGVAVLVMG